MNECCCTREYRLREINEKYKNNRRVQHDFTWCLKRISLCAVTRCKWTFANLTICARCLHLVARMLINFIARFSFDNVLLKNWHYQPKQGYTSRYGICSWNSIRYTQARARKRWHHSRLGIDNSTQSKCSASIIQERLSTGEYVTYLSMRKMLNHVTGDHDYSI